MEKRHLSLAAALLLGALAALFFLRSKPGERWVADQRMTELAQALTQLAEAYRMGAAPAEVAELADRTTAASGKLDALNLSEEDMKKLMEKHKDEMRKPLAKLVIYGRYNLTSDQLAILTVQDEPKLTGSWTTTHNPNAGAKFVGDDMALTDMGCVMPATFRVDATKDPKTIDITLLVEQPDGKSKMLGIYEVGDDTLKLCLPDGGDRPSEFENGPGRRLRFFTRSDAGGEMSRKNRRDFPAVFSLDGRRQMHIVAGESRDFVIVDGVAGSEYHDVGQGSLRFSEDGARTAYVAKRGKKWLPVVDGSEGPECDGIGHSGVRFSPDGKRVAYVAGHRGRSEKWFAVVDGVKGNEYDGIDADTPVFSLDSKHVAYVARRGESRLVVADEIEGASYDDIDAGTLHFDTAQRVTYSARMGKNRCLVVNGVEGPLGCFTREDAIAARHAHKNADGWRTYDNEMTQFSIDCPLDWAVIELDTLNGATLVSDDVTVEASGFRTTSTRVLTASEVAGAFMPALMAEHAREIRNGKAAKTRSGIVESMLCAGPSANGGWSAVLVAVSGGCGYVVHARTSKALPEGVKGRIEAVMSSFRVTDSVAADDLTGYLVEHRRLFREQEEVVKEHYEKGEGLLRRGELRGANAEYRAALSADSRDARVRIRLSTVYAEQGKPREALSHARAAVFLAPELPESYAALGVSYDADDRAGDAVRAFEKAIGLLEDPHDRRSLAPRYGLMRIYCDKGDAADARKGLDQARKMLEIDQDIPSAHYVLGVRLCNTSPRESEKHLRRYLELTERKPDVGDREKAKELLHQLQK
jgi:uncharacterized protein (TIGR03067 family)